jgi:hypothetical protein
LAVNVPASHHIVSGDVLKLKYKKSQALLHDQEIYNFLFGQSELLDFVGLNERTDFRSSGIDLEKSENNYHFLVKIELAQDYLFFERSNYNILMFLGDTGALYGVLIQIGFSCLTVTRVLTMYLDGFVIKEVFGHQTSGLQKYPDSLFQLAWLNFSCRRDKLRRFAKMKKVATRRINRHLDLVLFLKKMLLLDAILEAITSSKHRNLAR